MTRWRMRNGAVVFEVRLTPRGRRDLIEGWRVGADGLPHLKVRVAAAPEDGKANDALIALLAKTFSIAKAKVAIVAGQSARLKTISVATPDVVARLDAFGEPK